MVTVGSYEAKTHLPALLKRVARGERIRITKHGVPIAMLVPIREHQETDLDSVIEEIQDLRKGNKLGALTIGRLIDEGRRS